MNFGEEVPQVTWEQVIALARSLESAARRDDVPPQVGARLVRLVLEFDRTIVGTGVHNVKPSRPPPATSAG